MSNQEQQQNPVEPHDENLSNDTGCDINIREKINVALKEYEILHHKISEIGKRIETQVIQLYLVAAGIFTICLPNLSNPNNAIRLMVDTLMILLLPISLFTLIIFTLVLDLRIVYHGQYLAVVEARINSYLNFKPNNDTNKEKYEFLLQIVDYEKFHSKWGPSKRKFSNNADIIMLFLTYILITLPPAVIRLYYNQKSLVFLIAFITILTIGLVFTAIVACAIFKENNKLKNFLEKNKWDN